MRKFTVLLVLSVLFVTSFECLAMGPVFSTYFRHGGAFTYSLLEKSNYVDSGLSLQYKDSVFSANQENIYVLMYGHLDNKSAPDSYVIQLPLEKHKQDLESFYNYNHHVGGRFNFQLNIKHLYDGEKWQKVENYSDKFGSPDENELIFKAPATFLYTNKTPVYASNCKIAFNAERINRKKNWLKVFAPVTYVLDIVTCPLQLPIIICSGSKI